MKSTPENIPAKSSMPSEEVSKVVAPQAASSDKPADTPKSTQPHVEEKPASAISGHSSSQTPQSDSSPQSSRTKNTNTSATVASGQPQPPVPPPHMPEQFSQLPRSGSSLSFLSIASLLLATGAVVCAVMMWQRMGQMEQHLNLSLQQGSSVAETARAMAQQSLDASNDARGRLSYVSTQIETLNEQGKRIDTLMQLVNNSENKTLTSDLRAMLQSAQLQTQLTGSVEPLLVTLQTIDERLTQDSLPTQSSLRSAIAIDIDNIRNAAIPDPMRMSAQINELLDRADGELPLLIDTMYPGTGTHTLAAPMATADTSGLSGIPVQTNESSNHAASVQDNVLGYLERSWDWTSEKATELGTVIWGHVGKLVQVTPISNRDAMLISPEQGVILRENIKLRLLNLRISVLQRQYAQAEKDVDEILISLNTYFNPEHRNVQELLRRLSTLKTGLQNVALPQPNATLSELASMGQHQ